MALNLPSDTQYVTVPDLVKLWDLTPSKVHRLFEDHQLAAVRVNGVLSIPADFVQPEGPLPPLRGTLLALNDAGFTQDEALNWMYSDNEELGETPIAALLGGRKSAVRRATQGLAF